MSQHVEPKRGPTVAAGVIRELVDVLERVGVSRDRFVNAAQFDSERLNASDARFSHAEIGQLVELAYELADDEAFGLHWSESIGEASFGPISPLVAHAATLRQAFAALDQFHGVLTDQQSYQLEERDGEVTVRCVVVLGESARLRRFSSEMVLGGWFRLIRSFNTHARLQRLCFAFPAPAYREEYTRVFGHEGHFEQEFSGIVFQSSLMDAPAPHNDNDVLQALQAVAERRLMRIKQRKSHAAQVRETLLQERWPQRADMGSVARALGISERSLRRRLAAEGTSYGEVVNQALAMVAKRALLDRRVTIQETAYRMGFSDASTFHRAFKSWTGMTPGAYRETQDNEHHGGE